ncbi:hypothetical protein T484DRAFT_1813041 [Baffinella frigidus]|nr:hypothetical protein T484DRAFT_1813041 [Cryptophyta sp. CCMP2293]
MAFSDSMYRRALAINETCTEAMYQRGRLLYLRLHDLQGAERCFEQTLDQDPNHALAMASLGVVIQDAYNLSDAAEALLQQSIALNETAEGLASYALFLLKVVGMLKAVK